MIYRLVILLSLMLTSSSFAQMPTNATSEILYYPVGLPAAPTKANVKPEVENTMNAYGFKIKPLLSNSKRKKAARRFLDREAPGVIEALFRSDVWKAMKNSTRVSWAEFDRIPLETLLDDVRGSSNIFKAICLDEKGISREASTEINHTRSEICYDSLQMTYADENWYEPRIFGKLAALAVQQHLKHFGVLDQNGILFDELAHDFEYWLKVDAPKPESVTVPTWFDDYRTRFSKLSRFSPSDPATYSCEFQYREHSGSNVFRKKLLSSVRALYEGGISFEPSMLKEMVYLMKGALQPLTRLIRFPKMMEGQEAEPFLALADTPPNTPEVIETQVDQQIRVSEEDNLLIEIAEKFSPTDARKSAPFVPAVSNYSENVLGYVGCTLR